MAARLSRTLIRQFDCGQSSTKSSANTEPTDRKSLDAIRCQNFSTTSTALLAIAIPAQCVGSHQLCQSSVVAWTIAFAAVCNQRSGLLLKSLLIFPAAR